MKTHKFFTKFIIAAFTIFAFLIVGHLEIAAQTKSKTRKRIVSTKPIPTGVQASKPKETIKPKASDYDLGIRFEVTRGSFLLAGYSFNSVVITNRDRRPVTIKSVMANGERELYMAGANLPKVLTIGDKLRVLPGDEYKKDFIFIEIETDLGVQTYKAKQQ